MQVPYLLKNFAFALFGVLAVSALGIRFIGASEQPDSSPDTPDSLDWVRQEIVGTWIEDVSGQVGNFKRGAHEWVFTSSPSSTLPLAAHQISEIGC